MTDAVSMDDFIFGTLASDEDRLRAVVTARRGLTHSYQIIPRDPEPGQVVRVEATAGANAPVKDVFIHFTIDGSLPTQDSHTIPLDRYATEWDTLLWNYVQAFAGELPGQPEGTVVRYRISGLTASGTRIWANDGQQFSYAVDRHRVPAWVQESVIYHILVDRFAPAPGSEFARHTNLSGFFGGTLRGVLHRLDYLSELGVNAVWLSPIFPSPSHHGYDATDFRSIEPRLGSPADLKALVDEMHRRGMRLILDFVPNHTSNKHPFFESAHREADSPYRDYYTFARWPDQYKTFFGVKALPQINNENAAARRYVIDSAVYWLQEFGVDGFRLDYAYGPSHDFWTDYYQAVKAANPDSFHVGEIVETPALLRSYEGLLDGALDFLWLQMARKLFAFGTADVAQFEQFLSAHERYFAGLNFVLPTFLDNHDMNRFLWVTRGNKRLLRLAAVCQFTLGATPIIYYGTEAGLSQLRDIRQGTRGIPEESRLPMPWGDRQDQTLYTFYQRLIRLRKESPALRTGLRTAWLVDPAAGRYAYTRQAGPETVVVLLNVANTAQRFDLPSGAWRDALEGKSLPGSVELEPYGYLIARQG